MKRTSPLRCVLTVVLAALATLYCGTASQAIVEAEWWKTNNYHTLAQVEEIMTELAVESGPSNCSKFALRYANGSPVILSFPPNLPVSSVNLGISGLDLGKNNTGTDKADVVIMGSQHAREWIGAEVALRFAKFLMDNRYNDTNKIIDMWPALNGKLSSELTVKKLLENSRIAVIPVANPQGYYITKDAPAGIRNQYWRKNYTYNGELNGVKYYGVDINRNFPYKWYTGAPMPPTQACSKEIDAETYVGSAAGSEKETQGIRQLFLNRNVRAAIDYHAYGNVVICPPSYANTFSDIPTKKFLRLQSDKNDEAIMVDVAEKVRTVVSAAGGNAYQKTTAYGFYNMPVYGSGLDWAYADYGSKHCLGIAVEMGPDLRRGDPDFHPADILGIAKENIPGALFVVNWAVDTAQQKTPGVPPGN